MSTATLEREQQEQSFVMPTVAVGDIVFWYQGADRARRGLPFLVEAVFADSVDLKGVASSVWHTLKQGIRHVDDPRLKTNDEWRKGGAWDYSPHGKRINQLERDVERMGSEIRHLLGQINQLRGKKDGEASPKGK